MKATLLTHTNAQAFKIHEKSFHDKKKTSSPTYKLMKVTNTDLWREAALKSLTLLLCALERGEM